MRLKRSNEINRKNGFKEAFYIILLIKYSFYLNGLEAKMISVKQWFVRKKQHIIHCVLYNASLDPFNFGMFPFLIRMEYISAFGDGAKCA